MRRQKDERVITPIIAVVLLIMMTVAAAGAAYVWVVALQKKMQQSSTQQSSIFTTGLVKFVSANCNSTSSNITIIIRNVGKSQIPSGNVTLEIKDASTNKHLNTFYKYSNAVSPSQIVTYSFNTTDTSESLEGISTPLDPDKEYSLTITMPDGSYDVTTCTAS